MFSLPSLKAKFKFVEQKKKYCVKLIHVRQMEEKSQLGLGTFFLRASPAA